MTFTVFGYGSLIWKPPPHVKSQVSGFLKGYVRRFAQSSSDHRGTPEKPGRVVTLIHVEEWDSFSGSDPFPHEDVVWGVAFTIDPEFAEETRAYLTEREKDGYSEEYVDVWGFVNGVEKIIVPRCLVYVGRNDNPSFVGREPIDQLARHIWKCHGLSGPNKEYLYKLSESVQYLAPQSHDSHLWALNKRVRKLDGYPHLEKNGIPS